MTFWEHKGIHFRLTNTKGLFARMSRLKPRCSRYWFPIVGRIHNLLQNLLTMSKPNRTCRMIDITYAFCNNAPLICELHKYARPVPHRQQSLGDGSLKDTEESTCWARGTPCRLLEAPIGEHQGNLFDRYLRYPNALETVSA